MVKKLSVCKQYVDTAINKLLYLVNGIFIVLFGYYLALNICGNSSRILLSFGFFLPVTLTGLLLLPSINDKFRNISEKTLNKVSVIINTVAFVLMVVFAVIMRTKYYLDEETYSWDFGMVCDTALQYAKNSDTLPVNPETLSRYPNNHCIIYFLYYIFKFINYIFPNMPYSGYSITAIIINCIFIEAAVVITLLLAKKLLSYRKAFLCGCLINSCIPIYAYSPFYYTDTLSMPFVVGLLYVYVCFLKTEEKYRKILLTILFSVLAVIGFEIKATVIFIVAAVILDMIFRERSLKVLKSNCKYITAIFLLFVLLNGLLSGIYSKTFKITQDDYEQYKYPVTHWIMMSLNPDGTGSWTQSDDFITRNAGNYDDKIKANIKEIKHRIDTLGFAGIVKHIFYTKGFRTWASGTLSADYFLSINPVYPNILHEFFGISGKYHAVYVTASMLYLFILMLLILVSSIKCYIEKSFDKMTIIFTPILMLALFLMIWESNSRYILNMIPLMIIAGVYGFDRIVNFSYKFRSMLIKVKLSIKADRKNSNR